MKNTARQRASELAVDDPHSELEQPLESKRRPVVETSMPPDRLLAEVLPVGGGRYPMILASQSALAMAARPAKAGPGRPGVTKSGDPGLPASTNSPGSVPPETPGPNPQQLHWRQWLASPAGRYVLAWEQAHLDNAVANLFGFVGVQCGLRELQALRQNRMRTRFLMSRSDDSAQYDASHPPADVVIDSYEELPLASASADLVVLPHVLEFATDPHQTLREVDRVLRPDGRVIVTGFNPVSLWGISQGIGRLISRPVLPPDEHFIGLPRLRDWCKLLSFEFQAGSYGCYRPLLSSQRWLDRTAFLEKAGDRWWPICGAVYSVTVIKRVRGMRMVDPLWKRSRRRSPVAAVAAPVATPQFGGISEARHEHRLPGLRLVSSTRDATCSRKSLEG